MYTYDVYWDTSDITWSSRWDAYLRMPGGKVRSWGPVGRWRAANCHENTAGAAAPAVQARESVQARVAACARALPFWLACPPALQPWHLFLACTRPPSPALCVPLLVQVHWFSILNSLMVVVVMSCIVAMIMMRTIRRDLQRYEQLLVDGGEARGQGHGRARSRAASRQRVQPPAAPLSVTPLPSLVPLLLTRFRALGSHPHAPPHSAPRPASPSRLRPAGQGQDVEESGWKMVSGDVFRAPSSPLSLCVQIGSGVQILASGFITLLFAALGFLSPASRGSLLTAALVMYLLLSVAAGYSAVWLWGLVNRSYEGWFKVGAPGRGLVAP